MGLSATAVHSPLDVRRSDIERDAELSSPREGELGALQTEDPSPNVCCLAFEYVRNACRCSVDATHSERTKRYSLMTEILQCKIDMRRTS